MRLVVSHSPWEEEAPQEAVETVEETTVVEATVEMIEEDEVVIEEEAAM